MTIIPLVNLIIRIDAGLRDWSGAYTLEPKALRRIIEELRIKLVRTQRSAEMPAEIVADLIASLCRTPYAQLIKPDRQLILHDQVSDRWARIAVAAGAHQAALLDCDMPVDDCTGLEVALSELMTSGSEDLLRHWVQTHLVPLSVPRVKAYVVSALTGLSDDEHAHVKYVCEVVAGLLDRHGIDVHLPTDHTDPHADGDIPPEMVHRIDYSAVLASDLVVMIADHPTSGGGKELVWAERNRCKILVLSPIGARVSRLVTGSSSDLREVVWTDETDLIEQLSAYLGDEYDQMLAHAEERRVRPPRYSPLMDVLEERYAEIREALVSGKAGLTVSRLDELLLSADHLASASVDELLIIADRVGLSMSALCALLDTAEVQGGP